MELKSPVEIGQEYIIEVVGEDEKKIYFVCLLCHSGTSKHESYPLLNAHLSSEEHQWKFLVTQFPETASIVSGNKKFSDKKEMITNCVCHQIAKNTEPRSSSVFNYKAYEMDPPLFDNDVLEKIVSYDKDLEFVVKMNKVLKEQAKDAEDVTVDEAVEDSEVPERRESQDTIIISQEAVVDLTSPSSEPESSAKEPETNVPETFEQIEEVTRDEDAQPSSTTFELTKTTNEWENDITDSSNFVSFSPVREELPLPAVSDFKIISVESLLPENSEVDRRNEALISLYKKKMKNRTQELDYHFQHYHKHPSSHPDFHEQWKAFYLKQNFAIVSSGVLDFNYKPAWNVSWWRYLQGEKSQELDKYESKLRIQLNIHDSVPFTTKLDFQDLSDISEDELEFQSPMKRQRIDLEQEPADEVYTDHDRMIIAYQLAYKHFQEDKQLSPDQLSQLVSEYCTKRTPESLRSQSSTSQHLTDNDILILYKKFKILSPNEQASLISFVNSLGITDKARYLKLSYKLKMQENDW